MKERLNEEQADVKERRMKQGTIVKKLKIKYLKIYISFRDKKNKINTT